MFCWAGPGQCYAITSDSDLSALGSTSMTTAEGRVQTRKVTRITPTITVTRASLLVLASPVELSTSLREVSQCPEKASDGAFYLLKVL